MYFRLIAIPLFLFLISGCGNRKIVSDNVSLSLPAAVPPPTTEEVESVDYGDTIVFHMDADAVVLNPLICDDLYSRLVCLWIFNGLVNLDERLELKPSLAETFEVSSDGKQASFHLRKDVKWHDGEEFTTDDVVFTYQKIMDPDTRSRLRFSFSMVDTIEVQGKFDLKVKYKLPNPDAISLWTNAIVARHVYDNRSLDPNLQPVGTGPFRFVEWLPHDHILLEANMQHFRGRPFVDRFLFKYVADFTMAFQMVKQGEIDIMELTADQYLNQAEEPDFLNKYTIHQYNTYFNSLCYNCRNPLFKSPRVRRALTMAIDRQAIVNDIFHGYAYVPARPVSPPYVKYEKKLDPWPYSPDTARRLLESEGWRDTDNDGILEQEGRKFSFEVSVVHGTKNRYLALDIAAANLKKIGVIADCKYYELGQFMRLLYTGSFAAIDTGLLLQDDPYQYFHSSQIFDLQTGNTGLNLVGYRNPEVDSLLDLMRSELNPAERMRLIQRFHELVSDDQPATFMYSDTTLLAVSKRIRGIKPGPDWIFHNMENWYVPRQLQKYVEGN
ncbi:MAG: ABC transporter substrate-binding protein [Candidatus Wallbacteria bacterium]|nr:ABC transporter substrate-binding protein [Candidatus Wallbacteria bacterium]